MIGVVYVQEKLDGGKIPQNQRIVVVVQNKEIFQDFSN